MLVYTNVIQCITGGLITFRAFMDWFKSDDGDDEAAEDTYDQIPESVRRGLKEDGIAAGADDDPVPEPTAAAAAGDGIVGFTDLAQQ